MLKPKPSRDTLTSMLDKYFNERLAGVISTYCAWRKWKEIGIDDKSLEQLANDPESFEMMFCYGVPRMGDCIKKLREEKGISRQEMADRIGEEGQTIEMYETGKIEYIPYISLEAIRKELGCTREYLVNIQKEIEHEKSRKNKRKACDLYA